MGYDDRNYGGMGREDRGGWKRPALRVILWCCVVAIAYPFVALAVNGLTLYSGHPLELPLIFTAEQLEFLLRVLIAVMSGGASW